jgi:hypothetical protein
VPTPFDPGYGQEPFCTLVADVPGSDVFPPRGLPRRVGPVKACTDAADTAEITMEDVVRVFAGVQFLIIGLSHASSTPNSSAHEY